MRWFTFLLLAAIVLTLQSCLAPRLEVLGARPDWLLVVVVFFSLYARPREAAIGAWIIGAGADLMTIERLGLLALTYTVVAVAVAAAREYVFRHRAVTRFLVTLAASLLVSTGWMVYRHVLYDSTDSLLSGFSTDVIIGSIYTAAWAPLLQTGLWRMSRVFGLPRPRYTYAGLHRMGTDRV